MDKGNVYIISLNTPPNQGGIQEHSRLCGSIFVESNTIIFQQQGIKPVKVSMKFCIKSNIKLVCVFCLNNVNIQFRKNLAGILTCFVIYNNEPSETDTCSS